MRLCKSFWTILMEIEVSGFQLKDPTQIPYPHLCHVRSTQVWGQNWRVRVTEHNCYQIPLYIHVNISIAGMGYSFFHKFFRFNFSKTQQERTYLLNKVFKIIILWVEYTKDVKDTHFPPFTGKLKLIRMVGWGLAVTVRVDVR